MKRVLAVLTCCVVPLLVARVAQVRAADAMAPTLPAIGSEPAFPQKNGTDLYAAACQACHMPEGGGASGAGSYPALSNNPRLKPKLYPITRILNGSKAMPAFKTVLTDEQIVAIVGYVRTHFGNHYHDQVTLDDVKGLRQ